MSGEGSGPGEEAGFAVEKRIVDIQGETPCVSVIGTVISRRTSDSSFVLDDGTGQIAIHAHSLPQIGRLIRAIAHPFVSEGDVALDASIIQDFSDFDVDLYRRITELEAEVFNQENDSHQ